MSAPSVSGCWKNGEQNVLSTTTKRSAVFNEEIAAMSMIRSVGLVGVSTQSALVSGRMAARVASDDLFEELSLPVALIAGSFDPIISLDETRATARSLSDATLEILECGHSPWFEAPDALNAALEGLVRRAAAHV